MCRLRVFFPQATVGQHGLHEDEQTKKNAMTSAEDLGEYKGRWFSGATRRLMREAYWWRDDCERCDRVLEGVEGREGNSHNLLAKANARVEQPVIMT